MNDEQTLAGAFAPLRFDAQFLQRAYESGSECRSKEIVALEDAIASVLRVIPALSSVFEHNSEITGGTFSRSIAKALFIQSASSRARTTDGASDRFVCFVPVRF